jgi:hypothetical protein
MIKKYAVYLGIAAAITVSVMGMIGQFALDLILIRAIIAFFAFFVVGQLLGVITLEALIERQEGKMKDFEKLKNGNSSTGNNEKK